MNTGINPQFQETASSITFLINPLKGKQHIMIDDWNPRLSYFFKGGKAHGLVYIKDANQPFREYSKSFKKLIDFAAVVSKDNELGTCVWWARFYTTLWEMRCEGEYEDPEIADLNDDYIIKLPPTMVEEKSEGQPAPPRNLEDAGIVGFFDYIRPDDRYKVIFENTLGYVIHGIDAILRDEKTGRIIIVELKGTSLKIRSPLSYLKITKTKGRQLSREWIFKSLLSAHKSMATSAVFLYCLKPIFEQRLDRWLVVTRSDKTAGVWKNEEVEIFKEEELKAIFGGEVEVPHQPYHKAYHELLKKGFI